MKKVVLANYAEIDALLVKRYKQPGFECTIKGLNGKMYGNDECFDMDEFYQYFLLDNGELYKYYYSTDDCAGDFGDINYDKPYRTEHQDTDLLF